jgi:hypothetical protein
MASSNGKAFHQGGTIMRLHQIRVRAAALVIFASCLAAHAQPVTVTWGEYGYNKREPLMTNTGPHRTRTVQIDKRVPVTDIIKKLVASKQENIEDYEKMNDIFHDPAPGRVKTLYIKFKTNGKEEEKAFDERDLKTLKDWVKETRAKNGVR